MIQIPSLAPEYQFFLHHLQFNIKKYWLKEYEYFLKLLMNKTTIVTN